MKIDFDDSQTFYLVNCSASEITNGGWRFAGEEVRKRAVRFVRGTKSRTPRDLFNEFSAALQFPYYFGENWNAFKDCITDLSWLETQMLVLVILDSASILQDEQDSLPSLMRILTSARSERSLSLQSISDIQKDLPFFVVLHTANEEDADSVRARFSL